MDNFSNSLDNGRVSMLRSISAIMAMAMIFGWSALSSRGEDGLTTSAPRQFAPGVETTIEPELAPEETVSTHDVMEVRTNADLEWEPEMTSTSRTLYGMSEGVKFRRAVWCLEFTFKPLRMMVIDIPQPTGKMQRKLIWYMVYRVRNTGQTLVPVELDDGTYAAEQDSGEPVHFLPQFVLEARDRSASGEPLDKAYLDRVIPTAAEAIRQRETPRRRLLNSVEMAKEPIPVSDDRADRSVWGIAIWEDVDPRIDFFSVYVGGLTNAYRWVDTPEAYQPGDAPGKGRRFERKVLQLNFWRPGDEMREHESEIRFGVPPGKSGLYDVLPGVAYRWVYR